MKELRSAELVVRYEDKSIAERRSVCYSTKVLVRDCYG